MDVSILIPAFRPTFLRQAIASALTQGSDEFEILVSDDSKQDEVKAVVERFGDPRIRYIRTPGGTGAAENCRRLWNEARHDLLKFLFDDDLLMPNALVELTALAKDHPAASLYFGQRHTIDPQGRIIRSPAPWNQARVELSQAAMTATVVGQVRNPIGEFTNVLINRGVGVSPDDFLRYMGFEMHVIGDVALYLSASRLGPVVGTSLPIAAFRRHTDQNSSPQFNPSFAIGICEWELLIRGEHQAGRLTHENALAAIDKLDKAYANWGRSHPDIALLAPGLKRLRGRVQAGETDVLDDAFRQGWQDFVDAVHRRGKKAPVAPSAT